MKTFRNNPVSSNWLMFWLKAMFFSYVEVFKKTKQYFFSFLCSLNLFQPSVGYVLTEGVLLFLRGGHLNLHMQFVSSH